MSKPSPRIAQVEGLRAVAAGAVFLTHLGQRSHFTSDNALGPVVARLNVGVTIFFVITGYLLYRPWVAARLAGRPTPRVGRYAVRRLARIVPAYWLALIVLGLLLPDFVRHVFDREGWASFAFLQVYSYDWLSNGLTVAWSLCTEMAFYALLPALAFVVVRAIGARSRGQQIRIELLALGCSALVAVGLLEVAHSAQWGPTYPITVAGKWPWFAVGMALAVASVAWPDAGDRPRLLRSARSWPWLWWGAAGAVLLIAAAMLPREVFFMTYRDAMLETVLFALLAGLVVTPVVFGTVRTPGSPARLLAARPITWLGAVSYGIFLWHLPIIDWTVRETQGSSVALQGVVSLAITLPCAAASWYLLERPIINLAHGRPSRDVTAARVDAMAEQNPTPLMICVVCGQSVAADEAVPLPEHHESGEIISTLVRHVGCDVPAAGTAS